MNANLIYNEVTGKHEASYPSIGTANPIVKESGSQTLANKTLASPVMTGTVDMTAGSVRLNYTVQLGGRAKIGATAGWIVAAATDLPYVGTQAAGTTAATLVFPVVGLHIGDTITGFRVIGQIEAGGNTATLDADLRAVTNVAAEPTDASIGTITQVTTVADLAFSAAKTGLTEVVTSGKTYYILITSTTGASTDIILLAGEITVTTA